MQCMRRSIAARRWACCFIILNLPDMSQLPTSPIPKRGTSGPGNVLLFYIFLFLFETLVLVSTLSAHVYTPPHYSNLHSSHHNLKLAASHLTYINLIYFTILKGVAILRVGKVLSMVHFLRNGTKSFQNFNFTSLSLYLTVLNITLIFINNCSLLNPGPKDPNKISVFYQNI